MRYMIACLFVAVVLAGCSGDSSLNNPLTSNASLQKTNDTAAGTYLYEGLARDGSVIVRGHMTLAFGQGGSVTGRWEFRSNRNPRDIGPQVGTGTLVGTYDNGTLNVNLNPSNTDNNVVLTGRFNRNQYAGRWQWIGFRGIMAGGTFDASRSRTATEGNAD